MRGFVKALSVGALALTLMLGAAGGARALDDSSPGAVVDAAKAAFEQFQEHKQWRGVINMLGATKAVFLAPDFKSGSFIVGVESGTGVMFARHGEAWSDPVFIKFFRNSVGFQAGVKESELLLFVLTRDAVVELVDGVGRVAGSGGFALGGLGAGASGGGGFGGGLQILTVSAAEGLSLGSGLADAKMQLRDDLNSAAYGADFDAGAVLDKPGGALSEADALRGVLEAATKSAWLE